MREIAMVSGGEVSTMAASGRELAPLAAWSHQARFEDIPHEVVKQAKWSVLDWLGVAISCLGDETIAGLRRAERVLNPANEASVIGFGETYSIAAAAKINASAGSINELADNVGGHANEATIPMALALGENRRLDGKSLITAIVVGDEVSTRLKAVYGEGLKASSSFCSTPLSAWNTLAAGVVASRLLGQEEDQLLATMNVGLSLMAVSPKISIKDGAPIKPLMFSGWPVYAAYHAAIYAQNGVTAAPNTFHNDFAGWLATTADSWTFDALSEGLGLKWVLERPDRKRHACCGYNHAALDASVRLVADKGLDLDRIAGIQIALHRIAWALVGVEPKMLNPGAAMFYTPYLVATSLTEGRPISVGDTSQQAIDQRLSNPAFAALMNKISVERDDTMPASEWFGCGITVTMQDGRRHETALRDARGRGDNQFTEGEIVEKFTGLVRDRYSQAKIDQIVEAVFGLDTMTDASILMDLLRFET